MNKIKFLGTAGARFVVMKQVRASGGIWLTLDDTNLLIDPGPGSLVKCLSSKPKLNPQDLDGIILTHKHIDHSNDINVMIEAMTNGGFRTKGTVFAPSDALDDDPVVMKYFRNHVEKIEVLKEKGSYKIGNISFKAPLGVDIRTFIADYVSHALIRRQFFNYQTVSLISLPYIRAGERCFHIRPHMLKQ